MEIKVISLEETTFYTLIEQVVERIQQKTVKEDKWISPEEARRRLRIGKTKLQELRNSGLIRYSQPTKKHILYEVESIDTYLTHHVKETF